MHTDHAQVIGRLGLDRSQSVNRGERGHAQVIEQPPQFRDCSREFCARTHQRDGFGRLLEQSNNGVGEPALRLSISRTRMGREPHRPGEFLLGFQQVGGNVDDHRPGTSAARPVESFGNGVGNFVDAANQPAPLGERKRHAEDVGFLEGVGSDQGTADLAGDADQRDRVHFRVRDAGNQIGRAGSAGRHRHSDLAGHPGVAFGRENRALLVPRQDVAHAAALERVIQRHDGAAGITEHKVNPFGAQTLQDDVGAFKHSPPVWRLAERVAFCLPWAANSSCCAVAHPQSRWGAASPSRAAG